MLLNCGKFSFFCFPCSISALCPTQSGSEQNTAQSKHAEQSTSSVVLQSYNNQFRQLPVMQLLPTERDFPLFVPLLLLLEPCVCAVPATRSCDLPSSLICTYFFLAAYFLHAFWMALAYPSYFLSLISSNRNSCAERQWGGADILHAKFKKKLYFTFDNSPVHFTLDPSWFLFHNCGIWDWNAKEAFLEEISGAWVAVALTSLPMKLHTPWWRKRNPDSPENTLLVQCKVLHWPFLQPPSTHSPKLLLLLSECYHACGDLCHV